MTWAGRRRFLIVIVLILVIGGLGFWHYAPNIFVAPMCTDGVQNGDEAGIDCGGSMCTNLCTSEVRLPTILWSRAFPVTADVYNVAASIENKNDAGTRAIPYEFKIYDKENILLARRGGTALVPPLGRYVIVETGIPVGNASVGTTAFAFSSAPALWERVPLAISQLRMIPSEIALDNSGPVAKLTATLSNSSPTASLADSTVAAVLYDENDNAVNVSKTFVPVIGPLGRTSVVFTWPTAFSQRVVRYDIVPIIDVFHTR